ncbi:DUF3825 domain-containing protein [Sphingobacterium kitahiroshimense]|uniref:DUF3825 domain-containing protein n=1 Tax=Sphingobacterium sp. B16(2022) TaxID=2914044 RepID=UPI00143921AD|nr:DUF3825 domain-containing protein [Sphingobacterium sp. B16(2022)]NJI73203.1 DUF3825 domain-containing protein [Sphingobacterium sp. B16(2022)]
MSLFDFTWFPNFSQSIEDLKELAMEDNWDYCNDPTGKHPILVNYVHHTFEKVHGEAKIEYTEDFCCFNTGLVTENQEEIFCYLQINKRPNSSIPYYFIGWRKSSHRDLSKFSKLADVANYITDPSDLIYNPQFELRINIDHIIQDNKERFPTPLNRMENYLLSNILQGTIEDAKRRVKRNYKTAIPQYYKGKLQLLLPLCLQEKGKADLALVIEKENDVYRASTCLTLDMAINNARLIAKPDDEWLKV